MNFPSISQDPCADDFVQNPYQAYEHWRDTDFVHWTEYNLTVTARYPVVNALLRDRRFGREAPEGHAPEFPPHLEPFYAFESRSMLEREPPTHTRLRGLVLRAFTSRRINALEGEVHQLCIDLIRQFPQGEFDLIPAFAEQIPVIVIARMIGVDEAHAPQLLSWSHEMVAMYQAGRTREIEDAAIRATNEFSDFIGALALERKSNPKDDLISHLIAAEAEGDRLTMDELVTTVILLLNAGHEATVHAIANGVKTALENHWTPTEETMTNGVEELLRIDPPLHMFTRYAMEDVEVFGQKFSQGEQVGLLLGAANHDPPHYPEPGVFDPNRKAADHTSFGAGLHFCIGAPLARLELKQALPLLFEQCPNIQITRPPRYANRYHFHGLEALWVKT